MAIGFVLMTTLPGQEAAVREAADEDRVRHHRQQRARRMDGRVDEADVVEAAIPRRAAAVRRVE